MYPLIDACAKINNNEAHRIIDEGRHNIDCRDQMGYTALMFACYNGMTDVAIKLIDKGCNLNLQEYSGDTALIFVLENLGFQDHKDYKLLMKIIKKNINVIDRALLHAQNAKYKKIALLIINYTNNIFRQNIKYTIENQYIKYYYMKQLAFC